METKINYLYSLISDDQIFVSFNNYISQLRSILDEAKVKLDNKVTGNKITPVVASLADVYSKIESKVVDKYINEKYKAHFPDLSNETLETYFEQATFLEKTFLDFEKGIKIKYMSDLEEMEIKVINIFNGIKATFDRLISMMKTNTNNYYDTLQKEIDFIWKTKVPKENNLNSEEEKKIEMEKNMQIINIFNYSIKVIKNPNILVEKPKENDEKKVKTEEKQTANNKEKSIPNNKESHLNLEPKLYLTDEDVYNIVSEIYSYDLKLINKSEYILDIEKEKIKVAKLTEKLLASALAEPNKTEEISDEEMDQLDKLLNKKDNFFRFLLALNNYRANGNCDMRLKEFNFVVKIFNKCLDNLIRYKDKNLESLLIILSETFYMTKDKEKRYIQKEIQSHEIFLQKEFWEHNLSDLINEELNKIENAEPKETSEISKEIKNKRIREILETRLITFSNYMKDFTASKDTILSIINQYIVNYQLEDLKPIIQSLLDDE